MTSDLRRFLLPTYARSEVTFVDGDGCWLVDSAGNRHLDFAAGIAVVGLGHRHPSVVRAARAQLDRLWHTSNLYWTEPMAHLASELSGRFGGAQSFFCNSGAEAVEAAIKYARKATGRPGVVAIDGSFHGRTMGALSVTGQPAKQAGFGPLLDHVRFVPPDDETALRATVAATEPGLILIEPVLGEGGVRPLQAKFLGAAAEAASAAGALLCFDEIQTGVGRTGAFFAWEHAGVRPAMATLAKGLANGLPIGCLLVADDHAGAFAPGDHASTFGGNPVACAAAGAVCASITDALLASVVDMGERLAHGLKALPGVEEVRGRGLLLGCDLSRPAADVVAACLARGLLITSAGATTLRLTPPLIVSAGEVDQALAMLGEVLAA